MCLINIWKLINIFIDYLSLWDCVPIVKFNFPADFAARLNCLVECTRAAINSCATALTAAMIRSRFLRTPKQRNAGIGCTTVSQKQNDQKWLIYNKSKFITVLKLLTICRILWWISICSWLNLMTVDWTLLWNKSFNYLYNAVDVF